jgi:hypothetical protein
MCIAHAFTTHSGFPEMQACAKRHISVSCFGAVRGLNPYYFFPIYEYFVVVVVVVVIERGPNTVVSRRPVVVIVIVE